MRPPATKTLSRSGARADRGRGPCRSPSTRRRSEADQRDASAGLFPQTMSVLGNRWGFALLVAAFVGDKPVHRLSEPARRSAGFDRGSAVDLHRQRRAGRVRQPIPADREGPGVVRCACAALQWAQRWFQAPEGPAVILTHTGCGGRFDAVLVCDQCAEPLTGAQVAAIQSSRARRNFGATWR